MKKYISVGIGEPTRELFRPISNRELFVKPFGGMWASPYTPNEKYASEWIEFNTEEMGGNHEVGYTFEISLKAKVYVINSYEDLVNLTNRFRLVHKFQEIDHIGMYKNLLDFEKISKEYDVIYLTRKGESETRMTFDYSLYGWDVESILVMNFDAIENIQKVDLKKE